VSITGEMLEGITDEACVLGTSYLNLDLLGFMLFTSDVESCFESQGFSSLPPKESAVPARHRVLGENKPDELRGTCGELLL
jgi:hypothetical protein